MSSVWDLWRRRNRVAEQALPTAAQDIARANEEYLTHYYKNAVETYVKDFLVKISVDCLAVFTSVTAVSRRGVGRRQG